MMGTVHRILDDVALMLSFLRFTGATGSAGPALCVCVCKGGGGGKKRV